MGTRLARSAGSTAKTVNGQRWKFRRARWARHPTARDPLVLVLQMTTEITAVLAEGRLRALWWDGCGRPIGRPRVPRVRFTAGEIGEPPPIVPLDLVPTDLAPVLATRVQHFVRVVVPVMIRAAQQTDQVIDAYHPDAALVGMAWSPEVRAIAARCRRRGVPVVGMQHGGSYGYLAHPGHYHHDLMHVDHWLAYGPGVVDEFARLGHGRVTT